jgi:hypothetical protein
MCEEYRKTLLQMALFAGSFLGSLAPAGFAAAGGDSGPYLIGHWKLNDRFSDFKPPGSAIVTDNTEFVFLNPTNLTLTLEYAFFATNPDESVTFCGCDVDTLKANGRVRYTMLGELQGGKFLRDSKHCPTQTDGAMKTIVFPVGGAPTNPPGNELEAGYQIDLFRGGRTEAPLLAVPINHSTFLEEEGIVTLCAPFASGAKKSP